MKACMVVYAFYEDDTRVRRYAEALADRGAEVEAIALRRPGQPERETIRGVDVHRIQERVVNETSPLSYLIKLVLFFLRSTFVLAWRHLRSPYQLIHVHSVPDFQVFSAIVPKLLGAKVILDIHDIVPEFYASKFKVKESSLVFRALLLVEKLSIAFSDYVIIANHLWETKLIERAVRADKVMPMINFPDLTIFSFRARKPLYADRFTMCYPGSLHWHQGLDLAVRAIAQIRDRVPNALLLIIGDGPERPKLQTLVQELGVEGMVELRAPMPLADIAQVMSASDVGIVPKRADSFGNEAFSTKIMEFMAMGAPVLAADTRIDKFYFTDEIVHFFQSGNVQDLSEKIVELASNPARREELRENARAYIQENSWDVRKREYLELVDRLTGTPEAAVAS